MSAKNKKLSDFEKFIKGKRITLMGLGVLGRGVNVAKFLAEYGAILTITDLKTRKELKESIDKLKKYKNINYVLGKHRLKDFQNKDLIIKSAGVPINSPYILEARKNNIPIEMDASFFAKFSEATIIGVTGTRGKSTVSYLIYEILKSSGRSVYLAGNIKGMATMPLLKKTKKGDFVVLELDSWQLQGFGDSKISPHIAVFTNFMRDHMNYYKGDMKLYWNDKANIFKYQKRGDFCITNTNLSSKIKTKGTKIIYKKNNIPKNWNIRLQGDHNKENIAAAIEVAKALGISESVIKKAVQNFYAVPGRLEKIKEYKGIEIYNDTNATTPDATLAALKALKNKKIILICGGTDKNLSYDLFSKKIAKNTKYIIFLDGSATKKIIKNLPKGVNFEIVKSVKSALYLAISKSKGGDIVLFSPAAASFGMFKNEYDRGDKFLKEVKKLK